MEDPRIISALFISLKMAYYNVLINSKKRCRLGVAIPDRLFSCSFADGKIDDKR